MKFVILLVFTSLMIVGNCQSVPPLRGFQIHKVDMTDPRCKFVIAEIFLLDQSMMNLSGYIPKRFLDVPIFIKKFANHRYKARGKREFKMKDIFDVINSPRSQAILDRVERIVAKLPGCTTWIKGYIKFWVAGILSMAKIQVSRFLELRP